MKRELREESGKGTGQTRLAVRAVTQKRKEDEGLRPPQEFNIPSTGKASEGQVAKQERCQDHVE